MADEQKPTEQSEEPKPVAPEQQVEAKTEFTPEQLKSHYEQKIAKMDETIKRNFADAEAWRKHQLEQKPLEEQAAQREKEALERAELAERKAAVAEAIIEHGLPKEAIVLLEEVPADKVKAKAEELAKLLAEKRNPTLRPNPLQGGSKDTKLSTADQFASFMESQLSNS